MVTCHSRLATLKCYARTAATDPLEDDTVMNEVILVRYYCYSSY